MALFTAVRKSPSFLERHVNSNMIFVATILNVSIGKLGSAGKRLYVVDDAATADLYTSQGCPHLLRIPWRWDCCRQPVLFLMDHDDKKNDSMTPVPLSRRNLSLHTQLIKSTTDVTGRENIVSQINARSLSSASRTKRIFPRTPKSTYDKSLVSRGGIGTKQHVTHEVSLICRMREGLQFFCPFIGHGVCNLCSLRNNGILWGLTAEHRGDLGRVPRK